MLLVEDPVLPTWAPVTHASKDQLGYLETRLAESDVWHAGFWSYFGLRHLVKVTMVDVDLPITKSGFASVQDQSESKPT